MIAVEVTRSRWSNFSWVESSTINEMALLNTRKWDSGISSLINFVILKRK